MQNKVHNFFCAKNFQIDLKIGGYYKIKIERQMMQNEENDNTYNSSFIYGNRVCSI